MWALPVTVVLHEGTQGWKGCKSLSGFCGIWGFSPGECKLFKGMSCRSIPLIGKSDVDTQSDLSCTVFGPWSLQEWLALQAEWGGMQKPCFCCLKSCSWRLPQLPVAYRLAHWVLLIAKLQLVPQQVHVATAVFSYHQESAHKPLLDEITHLKNVSY